MSTEAREHWLASRDQPDGTPEVPQTVAEYKATLARLGARFPGMVRQRAN